MKSLKRSGDRPLGARMPPNAFGTVRPPPSSPSLSSNRGAKNSGDTSSTNKSISNSESSSSNDSSSSDSSSISSPSNSGSSTDTMDTADTTSSIPPLFSTTTLQHKQQETQKASHDSEPRTPAVPTTPSNSFSPLLNPSSPRKVSPSSLDSPSSSSISKSPSQKSEKMNAIPKNSVKKFVSTFENTSSNTNKAPTSPTFSGESPKIAATNSSSSITHDNNYTLTRKSTTSSVSSTSSIDSIGKALQDLSTIPIQKNTYTAKSSNSTASSTRSSFSKPSLSPSTSRASTLSGSSLSQVSSLSAKFESPKRNGTSASPVNSPSHRSRSSSPAKSAPSSADYTSATISSSKLTNSPSSKKPFKLPITPKSPVSGSSAHPQRSQKSSVHTPAPIDHTPFWSSPSASPPRPSSAFSNKTNSDVNSVVSSIVEDVIFTTTEAGVSTKATKSNPYSAVPFSHKLQEKKKPVETPSIDKYATQGNEEKNRLPKYQVKQVTDISLSSSIRASSAGLGPDDDGDDDDDSSYAVIPNIKAPAWVTELKNQQNRATSPEPSIKSRSPVSKHKKSFSEDSSLSTRSSLPGATSGRASPTRTPITSRTSGTQFTRPVSPSYSHSPTRELSMLRAGSSSPTRPTRPNSASSFRSWNSSSDQDSISPMRTITRPSSAASNYSHDKSSKMVSEFLESRERPESPTRMSPKRTPVTSRTSSPVSVLHDKSEQSKDFASRPNSRYSLDSRISSKRENTDRNGRQSPVSASRATSVRTFYSAVSKESSSSGASLSRAGTISYSVRSNSPSGRCLVSPDNDEEIPLVPQFEKTFELFGNNAVSEEETPETSFSERTEETLNTERSASNSQSLASVSGSVSSRNSTQSATSLFAAKALQASPKLGKTPFLPPPSPAVSMQSHFTDCTSATSFYDIESIHSMNDAVDIEHTPSIGRSHSIISQHSNLTSPATISENSKMKGNESRVSGVENGHYRDDGLVSPANMSRAQSVTSSFSTISDSSRNTSRSSNMSRASVQTQMTDPDLDNTMSSQKPEQPQAPLQQQVPVVANKASINPDSVGNPELHQNRFGSGAHGEKPYYYLDINNMDQLASSSLSFWGPSGAPFANKDPRDVTVLERLLLDNLFCDIMVCYIFIVFVIA